MFINDEAIKEVARLSAVLDATASSHWDGSEGKGKKYELAENPLDFSKVFSNLHVVGPLGGISAKTSLPYRFMHWVLQIPFRIMGANLVNFQKIDRTAASLAKRQGRAYDGDLMRHTLTMALLDDRLELDQDAQLVAVIGDGFANMSALVLACVPSSQVILVSLTKTLLVDLVFLRKTFPDESIALVQNESEMKNAIASDNIRIIAVRADDARLLAKAPVTIGINIKSMMEMEPAVTAAYFDFLRGGPAERTAFYCCNVVKKLWADGTVICFYEYPWDEDDELIVDEKCPWDQYGYRKSLPFYYKRKKPTLHRLVYLKKRTKL